MSDDRGDVLKSLGVKRRRQADSTDAPPPAEKSSLGLGIKRRSGKTAESADPAASGSGLGIKRRSGRVDTAEAESEATVDAPPAPPWQGKLGSDDTAVMLRNHFKARPELAAQLPERLWDLHRTHGRYLGDGRPERTIVIGWEAAYVLFTLPNYPDGDPDVDPKTHKFVFPDGRPAYDEKTRRVLDPGPNRQPTFVERGFVVGPRLNEAGEWYVYAVWRSDGMPLQVEEAPAETEAATKASSRTLGLGIKRRR